MRRDTRQRKTALAGLRAISGKERMLGTLVRVISLGKQALDAVMLELDAWLRAKNGSTADSLLEAFEELLTLHRLKVPARLRKALILTNPIESQFSLVRHSERNSKRTRGSTMLQRWPGTVLLYCEGQFKRVKGYAGIAQVIATIEVAQAEAQPAQAKKAV